MPALPLDEAGKYVAAVYIFFVVLVLLYLGILSARIARLEKDAVEISELLDERDRNADERSADRVTP
jgi:Tfp pilus assembly protein PilP